MSWERSVSILDDSIPIDSKFTEYSISSAQSTYACTPEFAHLNLPAASLVHERSTAASASTWMPSKLGYSSSFSVVPGLI